MSLFRAVIALILIGVLSAASSAHGGGPHLLGVIKTIDAHTLVVTDREGKEFSIALDDKTNVEVDGKPSSVGDLRANARVVVHTKTTAGGLIAVLVKTGRSDSPHASK